MKMKNFVCIAYPDDESKYLCRAEWHCSAPTKADAEKKAFEHFPEYHEILVMEE